MLEPGTKFQLQTGPRRRWEPWSVIPDYASTTGWSTPEFTFLCVTNPKAKPGQGWALRLTPHELEKCLQGQAAIAFLGTPPPDNQVKVRLPR